MGLGIKELYCCSLLAGRGLSAFGRAGEKERVGFELARVSSAFALWQEKIRLLWRNRKGFASV